MLNDITKKIEPMLHLTSGVILMDSSMITIDGKQANDYIIIQ